MLALLVFAALSSVPTASASQGQTSQAPIAAPQANCVDWTAVNRHAGIVRDVYDWSARGVKATIDPYGYTMTHCSNAGIFPNNGASAWVAITPGSGNSYHNNEHAIIQIGIINCDDPLYAACNGTGYRYFWAIGGCGNPTQESPYPRDLGAAGAGPHEYEVYKSSDGYWHLHLDGYHKVGFVGADEGSVNCWQHGDKEASWYGETLDGGDQYSAAGATGVERLQFRDARYQSTVGGAWTNPGWSDPCDPGATNSTVFDHKCNVWDSYTDRFEIWSEPW